MALTSSIPPPTSRIPPFPAKDEAERCYISGQPFTANDRIILIAVNGGTGKQAAKLSALFSLLGIDNDEEQGKFCREFIGANSGDSFELLWFKLSRHRPHYHKILLSHFHVH